MMLKMHVVVGLHQETLFHLVIIMQTDATDQP